ncbi:hypothetical protein PCANC_07248 [Puccinia coronata f. sp. avenae]|uniref:DNA 3'-5' helicase n=1 Tax=Puccinia coronata f. sp. avenae TaxID=200324 RepID=A0A2N5VU69_9BASI|nr:hypothetical protein PCANC_07248 [Puccinia coronata f. sp. avenae]
MKSNSITAKLRIQTLTGINIYKKIFGKSDDKVRAHIKKLSLDCYGQESKHLQVETVLNLAKGRNTFLLAGTGFGKSQIAKLYFRIIPKKQHAVILTLNPLDTLGDNQVLEKKQAGFTAINLSKLNFNKQTAQDISHGVYQFVYLSPEIFLNNKTWDELFFSKDFQNRLGLIVVDEAHMIYIWGLVSSCKGSKTFAVHVRHADSGVFRPSYGNLGAQLLFRNNKPILLLSATCRPVAVAAISQSLKLDEDSLDILRGKLTRPEIRIIRVTMAKSLASSLDIIKVFPSEKDVENTDLVPSLVYSGSRNRTMTVLDVMNRAQQTSGPHRPKYTCARQFHSCTGDLDKVDCIEDFANEKFPIISCTMALGMGQNWKRVRMVVHMGRGDPANIAQMIGQCGHNGRPGLAVLFVEKTRRKGKNSVKQLVSGPEQTNEDRMDALAITPVCLRVAFSLDNLLGYVPISCDDPSYIKEREREITAGFPPTNFDDIMANKFTQTFDVDLKSKYPAQRSSQRKRKFTETKTAELDTYQQILLSDLKEYYNSLDVSAGELDMDDLFGPDEAKNLTINYSQIESLGDVRELIGGECFAGQLRWILNQIQKFQTNQAAFKSFLDSTPVLQKVARSSIHQTSPAHNSQSCPNTVIPLTTPVATARPLDQPPTKK